MDMDRGDDLAVLVGDRRRDGIEALGVLLAGPGEAVELDATEPLAECGRNR